MLDFWLATTYACGLISVDKNFIITETCPIYKWMRGKQVDIVLHYLTIKKQFVDLRMINA